MNGAAQKILVAMLPILLATTSCAWGQEVGQDACSFKYNSVIENDVVIPAMKTRIGDLFAVYDTGRPAIMKEKKGSVTLLFSYRSVDAIDTPTYVLTLQSCSLRVLQSYEATYIAR